MKQLDIRVFHREKPNGVYVFILDDCFICQEYLKELKKIDTSDWYLIDCGQNAGYFLRQHNVDDVPHTRVYIDGEIIWERSGALYEKQRRELFEKLK